MSMPGDRHASAPLFWLAVSAALGIIAAAFLPLPAVIPLVFALMAGVVGWRVNGRPGTVAVFLMGACVFSLYGLWKIRDVAPDDLRRLLGTAPGTVILRFGIQEDPELKKSDAGNDRLDFEAEVVALKSGGGWIPAHGRIKVSWSGPPDDKPEYGDVWEAAGFLSPPEEPENPGQFDYAGWLEGKGIFYCFDVDQAVAYPVGRSGFWIKKQAIRFKHHMLHVLGLGLQEDPETSALMAGMLFGYREGISDPLMEAFRVTGTLHVFAVSGQNVAVILGILLILLQTAGILPWRWGWLLLPLLLLFCLSTGMQPSAFRAWLMAAIVLMGWVFCRRAEILNLLGGAALLMWLWDPRSLFDLGFQMSFIVVLGLALLTPPIYGQMASWWSPDPWIPVKRLPPMRVKSFRGYKALCALLAASLAAWLASLPLVWKEFHLVAPVTVLANLCVVPLSGLVVIIAAGSVALGTLWSGFSVALNQVNWLILKVIVSCVVWLAGLPGAYFYAGSPWEAPATGESRLVFFSGRREVAGILESGGRSWLVDPGGVPMWKYSVDPYRRQRGIDGWEGGMLTGSGTRQLGSMPEVLRVMDMRWIAESGLSGRSSAQKSWKEFAADQSCGRRFWEAGDAFALGKDVSVQVLWPDLRAEKEFNRLEDRGLVMMLECSGVKVLWAGSLSREVEQRIRASGIPLKADVLVQGEHSSQSNLQREWLEAVKPRWLVRPRRGYFPDASLTVEFWRTVEDFGIQVLRMDETGAVTLHMRGGECRVETFRPEAGQLRASSTQ